MGDFRSLKYKAVYNSDSDNLLEDFYIPALKEAVRYDRAVGFFSAAAFFYAAQGLSKFCQSEGYMRLIIGALPSAGERDAIDEGYGLRKCLERLTDEIAETFRIDDALFENRLRALSWMIATNKLDIKLAVRMRGMFHEKVGILRDSSDNVLVFEGSNNETAYALLPDFNYETMHVFPSWIPAFKDHLEPHVDEFERIWGGKSPNTPVFDFPEALKEQCRRIAQDGPPDDEMALVRAALQRKTPNLFQPRTTAEVTPHIPQTYAGHEFKIRDHQLAALNAWRNQEFRAILELATGAGKTIAAIYGSVKVFENLVRITRAGQLVLCIAVPYINLADQWTDALAEFSIEAVPCFGNANNWSTKLMQRITAFLSGEVKFICMVVVNRTLTGSEFQTAIGRIPKTQLFFIGDECHHHSSTSFDGKLPPAQYTMGLSATPEHYISETRNHRLTDYYGEIAFRYTLADALREGVLTPYDYHIEIVNLTEKESADYFELSQQVSSLMGRGEGDAEGGSDPRLTAVLAKRSRLLGSAHEKMQRLGQMLTERNAENFTLIYCGDGSVEGDENSESIRQVEAVSAMAHRCGWRTSRYTSDESPTIRRAILDEFRVGIVHGLVAIRCLDEGVDIPACRTAYILASSRNPRQFIQRRGRILRKAPGKDAAVIYDFLVKLPDDDGRDWGEMERRLFVAELKRCAEFANLARNPQSAYKSLEPLLKQYNLGDRIDVVRL